MKLDDARAAAAAWSVGGYDVAVVELCYGGGKVYAWERVNSAIPPEIILEVYRRGERLLLPEEA